MNNYDFDALNDKEFEVLSADLLSTLLGARFERFKPGRDAGVDGRFFSPDGGENVFQAKHWHKSGLSQLLGHLQKSESPKVQRLKPKRYFLTTTVPLSRADKDKIVATFAPYIQSPSDIFGAEDITDALSKNPDVERRHFKLWLSSANALSAIFNASILGRSEDRLRAISDASRLFVQTAHYEHAKKRLEELHTVIITGEPGAGKTWLANHLCLEYSSNGFSSYFLEHSVEEAEAIWRPEQPQLFVFDDFLGRNYLQALERHEDSQIVNFIKRVGRDKTKRFLLTSRTTIINQGRQLAEVFELEHLRRNEYQIEVKDLTQLDRARILYNHIWFGNLSEDFVSELYRDKRYRSIVGHQNFNPRLIAFITDALKLSGIGSADYWTYVQRTLANPSGVWSHLFEFQLDEAGRRLVSLTALNGNAIDERILRTAFKSLNDNVPCFQPAQCDQIFARSTPVVVGAMLNRKFDARTKAVAYDLFSPSVGDFVLARYADDVEFLSSAFISLQTLVSLANLESMRQANLISDVTYKTVLRKAATAHLAHSADATLAGLVIHAASILNKTELLTQDDLAHVNLAFSHVARANGAQERIAALKLANKLAPNYSLTWGALEQIIEQELADSPDHENLVVLSSLVEKSPKPKQDEWSSRLHSETVSFWEDQLKEMSDADGIGTDVYDRENGEREIEESVENYLLDRLSEVNAAYFDADDVQTIMNNFSASDRLHSNWERAERHSPDIEHRGQSAEITLTADPIDDLFQRE